MPRAIKGVLVECDPSIKAIIIKIDSQDNAFIIEDLDDQHLVIREGSINVLKARLDDVLKETQQEPEESGSDEGN